MRIDTVVSHGDWFQAWGTFGTPSVYRIMGQLQDVGVTTVHWRTLYGARAKYPSKHEAIYWGDEGGGFDRPGATGEQRGRLAYDLRDWDQMKDVVRIGKEMGLRTSAWYTLYEESHFQTNVTRFAEEHPEFWPRTREGKSRHSKLSFGAPEVREHKLAVLEEQVAYGFDGVLLDFFRESQADLDGLGVLTAGTEVDDDGICIYGYEDVMLDAFRKATGKDARTLPNNDPEWLEFRVDQVTEFMRGARRRTRGCEVAVRVRSMNRMRMPIPWWETEHAPTNSRNGSFADWPRWVEEGLVDDIHLNIDNWDLFENMSVEKVWDETKAALALIKGRAKLTVGFFVYNMYDRRLHEGMEKIEEFAGAAVRAGADGVCLWETTSLQAWAPAPGGAGGRDAGVWPVVRKMTSNERPALHL